MLPVFNSGFCITPPPVKVWLVVRVLGLIAEQSHPTVNVMRLKSYLD